MVDPGPQTVDPKSSLDRASTPAVEVEEDGDLSLERLCAPSAQWVAPSDGDLRQCPIEHSYGALHPSDGSLESRSKCPRENRLVSSGVGGPEPVRSPSELIEGHRQQLASRGDPVDDPDRVRAPPATVDIPSSIPDDRDGEGPLAPALVIAWSAEEPHRIGLATLWVSCRVR